MASSTGAGTSCAVFVFSFIWMLSLEPTAGNKGHKAVGTQEYCNMEVFNATCDRQHVILIHTARFGRMKIGRCVKGNYGYLGCAADVKSYMETKCSGRHTCKMSVPDDYLYKSKPCPGDFTSYLETSYECLKVASGSTKECQASHLLKLTSPSGYIASARTAEEGLGSVHCPWYIRVKEGQRIRVTLLSFVGAPPGHAEGASQNQLARRQEICYDLAVVLEEPLKKTITVCPGEQRERTVFVSRTNEIKVEIVRRRLLSSLGAFLLKYEAVGCPDIKPIPNAIIRRKGGESMEVRCNMTDETWYLTCKDTKWIGEFGNCSDATNWNFAHMFGYTTESFPYGILLIVAIGVALGIVFGGIMLIFVVIYTRRHKQQSNRRREQEQCPVLENKPIIPSGNQTSEWTHRISFSTPDEATLRGHSHHVTPSQLPAMPGYSDPPQGGPSEPSGNGNARHFTTLERETNYGSAGVTLTSGFSSFKPLNRQHIYESPHFQ